MHIQAASPQFTGMTIIDMDDYATQKNEIPSRQNEYHQILERHESGDHFTYTLAHSPTNQTRSKPYGIIINQGQGITTKDSQLANSLKHAGIRFLQLPYWLPGPVTRDLLAWLSHNPSEPEQYYNQLQDFATQFKQFNQ